MQWKESDSLCCVLQDEELQKSFTLWARFVVALHSRLKSRRQFLSATCPFSFTMLIGSSGRKRGPDALYSTISMYLYTLQYCSGAFAAAA